MEKVKLQTHANPLWKAICSELNWFQGILFLSKSTVLKQLLKLLRGHWNWLQFCSHFTIMILKRNRQQLVKYVSNQDQPIDILMNSTMIYGFLIYGPSDPWGNSLLRVWKKAHLLLTTLPSLEIIFLYDLSC